MTLRTNHEDYALPERRTPVMMVDKQLGISIRFVRQYDVQLDQEAHRMHWVRDADGDLRLIERFGR